MRVEDDTIVIESRREIDELQNALKDYIKSNKCSNSVKEDMAAVVEQLDALYYCW